MSQMSFRMRRPAAHTGVQVQITSTSLSLTRNQKLGVIVLALGMHVFFWRLGPGDAECIDKGTCGLRLPGDGNTRLGKEGVGWY